MQFSYGRHIFCSIETLFCIDMGINGGSNGCRLLVAFLASPIHVFRGLAVALALISPCFQDTAWLLLTDGTAFCFAAGTSSPSRLHFASPCTSSVIASFAERPLEKEVQPQLQSR